MPLFRGFAGAGPATLGADLGAGLAIAAIALPSAIAYPAIAGLPPETGIYASIAPLIGYAILGPSRRLVLGPDAATMSVLAAVLAGIAATAPEVDPVGAAAALALGVGCCCMLARAAGLGVLATFLSRPILTGFFAGVSASIIVGQIRRVTGVAIESEGLIAPVIELIREAGAVHGATLALAAASFGLLKVMEAIRSPVPGQVVVVVAATLVTWALDLPAKGVATVGDLPAGLPSLALPGLGGLPLDQLAIGAASIFLVSFGAGIVTARSFADRTGDRVDPDAEMIGFGAGNIAAGLVGGFPVTASDSRTAINLSVGGRTQVACLAAALALAATLSVLNDALAWLPVPALGALLVAAALSMVDVSAFARIWRVSRMEFVFAVIAFLGPIGLGVLQGVAIAVVATLVYLLRKMIAPPIVTLGRVPGREGFYKLHRAPSARPVPGMALCLVEGPLLFFSADAARESLERIAAEAPPGTRWLVIDASGIPQIDGTGAAMLEELAGTLMLKGLKLGLAEVHAEVLALMTRAGVVDRIGHDMVFANNDEAMNGLARAVAAGA